MDVRQRIAMDEQHGWPVAAVAQVDLSLRVAALDLEIFETVEHWFHFLSVKIDTKILNVSARYLSPA
jgi:hypothetical protein